MRGPRVYPEWKAWGERMLLSGGAIGSSGSAIESCYPIPKRGGLRSPEVPASWHSRYMRPEGQLGCRIPMGLTEGAALVARTLVDLWLDWNHYRHSPLLADLIKKSIEIAMQNDSLYRFSHAALEYTLQKDFRFTKRSSRNTSPTDS
jgi:hypothetical protein